MKKCATCRYGESFADWHQKTPIKLVVGDKNFDSELPARICKTCGNYGYDEHQLSIFHLGIAVELIKAGNITNEVFSFLLRVADIYQRDFAKLTHTRPETVSRWCGAAHEVQFPFYIILAKHVLELAKNDMSMIELLKLYSAK